MDRKEVESRIADVRPTSYPDRSQPTDFFLQRGLMKLTLRGSWLMLSGYTADYDSRVDQATRHIQSRPDVVAGILDTFFSQEA